MGNPVFRPLNRELLQGTVDGKYKRIHPDWTNLQSPNRAAGERERREDMAWPYRLIEAPEMDTPDGRWVVPD